MPIPSPRIPDPSEFPTPELACAEALRLERVARALLTFARDFADRSRPFAERAAEYRAAAELLRAGAR